ncbi:hypothetical protein BC941DRAFT_457242 [Chlamydoabsidia padenii]|nr:hypothetical protein BC941DRAFT_457242 [Chlamydoabsidia padenii]
MTWTNAILKFEITNSTIQNCFKHTTLLNHHHFQDQVAITAEEGNLEESDDEEEVEETIDGSLETIYGSGFITSEDINYCFDDAIDEASTEADEKDEEEEVQFVNKTMPVAEVRKKLKRMIEVLPMNTETDSEIKRAMVKHIKEIDSRKV